MARYPDANGHPPAPSPYALPYPVIHRARRTPSQRVRLRGNARRLAVRAVVPAKPLKGDAARVGSVSQRRATLISNLAAPSPPSVGFHDRLRSRNTLATTSPGARCPRSARSPVPLTTCRLRLTSPTAPSPRRAPTSPFDPVPPYSSIPAAQTTHVTHLSAMCRRVARTLPIPPQCHSH